MNNIRLLSMLIAIGLVGLTLISLTVSYGSFQSDLESINKLAEDEIKKAEKERAEEERIIEEEYQLMLEAYYAEVERREAEKRQYEEEGRPYMKFETPLLKPIKGIPSISYHSEKFNVKREELSEEFNNKVIIYGIVIGFIILAEIGVLVALPRKDKTVNIVIKK